MATWAHAATIPRTAGIHHTGPHNQARQETREYVHDDAAPQTAVLPLARQATHLHVTSPWPGSRSQALAMRALAHLPHLTHADLDMGCTSPVVEALLLMPTLEHVTLAYVHRALPDLSQCACRWRTLTVAARTCVADLAHLPLGGLERLTLGRQLALAPRRYHHADDQAGLAVLQRLHGQGKLTLRKSSEREDRERWRLSSDDGLFMLLGLGAVAPAVLRLVLEAGQGINTLRVDEDFLDPAMLQQHVAPLLRQHPDRITTLCVDVGGGRDEEAWWGRLLGRLPASVTHLKMDVVDEGLDGCLLALVRGGGVGALRRPLTLTLMHEGQISDDLEAEVMELSLVAQPAQGEAGAGGGVGMGLEQRCGSLLALRVVRNDPYEE